MNPCAMSKDKWTPLTIAAQIGSYLLIEALISDSRTQINQISCMERGTALHVAANAENYQAV